MRTETSPGTAPSRLKVLAIFMLLVVLAIVLGPHFQPGSISAVSFELARTPQEFAGFLSPSGFPGSGNAHVLLVQTYLDFILILLYWGLLWSAAELLTDGLQVLMAAVKALASLAALSDLVENTGILVQLRGTAHSTVSSLTYHASVTKWLAFSVAIAILGGLMAARRKNARHPRLLLAAGLSLLVAGGFGALIPASYFLSWKKLCLPVFLMGMAVGAILSAAQWFPLRPHQGSRKEEEKITGSSEGEASGEQGSLAGHHFPGGGGDDAVCFTAGPTGAYFGAGVVHAYLAARRKNPVVVAGISLGAVSAAAMQKCYQDLLSTPRSGPCCGEDDGFQRWSWFRRYILTLTERPLSVIWDALPDTSDFFADMPPVRDRSLPKADEAEARKQRYILIKLGRRLANLPISLRTATETIIYYVRMKERYGRGSTIRFLSRALYLMVQLCRFVTEPVYDNFFKKARPDGKNPFLVYARPLFGWPVWCAAGAVSLLLVVLGGGVCWVAGWFAAHFHLLKHLGPQLWGAGVMSLALGLILIAYADIRPFRPEYPLADKLRSLLKVTAVWSAFWLITADVWLLAQVLWNHPAHPLTALKATPPAVAPPLLPLRFKELVPDGWGAVAVPVLTLLLLVLLVAALVAAGFILYHRVATWRRKSVKGAQWSLEGFLLKGLELNKTIVTDFYIKQRLKHLFDPKAERLGGYDVRLGTWPMPIVLVSASLQSLPTVGTGRKGAQQLWARPGVHLVRALEASLAKPGLMKPVPVTGEELKHWVDMSKEQLPRLDLVDGAVIRQNPLPALFSYLTRHKALAAKLCRPCSPSIHVVFHVPLNPRQDTPERPITAPSNIVDVGLLSLKLAERRDTKLEVNQTNFVSKLENLIITSRSKSGLSEWVESEEDVQGDPLETLPLSADCIAPEEDLDLGPALSPEKGKTLAAIAAGCRQTMQRLYGDQLRPCEVDFPCRDLLARVWAQDRQGGGEVPHQPGLPEVCAACTGTLNPTEEEPRERLAITEKDFPELTGEEPRVVFVASGGVFRGAFHVGVLAALLKAGIKIDLVVGASVGTLIGGALAAAASSPSQPVRDKVIKQLYLSFLNVDEKIALTAPFKSAIREVGVRARAIGLAPCDIQRMIARGSRFDPGFAVAGAPPALLDAISALFALPYEDTKQIAASFVSGHIAHAVTELLQKMKKETLVRLGIEEYLMGVSLLRQTAELLLFPYDSLERTVAQPYLREGRGVAMFGTATNLLTWKSILLGDPRLFDGKYNFVEAALSSSAFPAVFQPRRETDVYPGNGNSKVFYSDGGMFDNLPFVPALKVLATVQGSFNEARATSLDPYNQRDLALWSLKQRHNAPDLFIVGSLDAEPDSDPAICQQPYNSILSVSKRAAQLNANLKISDFELTGVRVHDQVERLLAANPHNIPVEACHDLNGIVDAAVLPIYPADVQHLNGTFAFCRTLGLEPKRMQSTVSDGCFQTLAAIAKALEFRPDPVAAAKYDPFEVRASSPDEVRSKSVWGLFEVGKVPYVARREGKRSKGDRGCPYFTVSKTVPAPVGAAAARTGPRLPAFPCPFAAAEGELMEVFNTCCSDKLHLQSMAAFQSPEAPERYTDGGMAV